MRTHAHRKALFGFVGGLALGSTLIGVALASSPSPRRAAAPVATAAAPAAPAAAGTTTVMADGSTMDMGASATGDTGGAPAPAPASAAPAARSAPYGAVPLGSTDDHGVKVFRIDAAPVAWRTDESHTVDAWAYNGQLPGPVIRGRVGERVRIVLTNHLPEPTTIHWHGINLPNSMDGVPGISQKPVPPGGSFTYEFTLRRPGLFMYHPHFNTLSQQTRGLYGVLVVDPPGGPAAGVQEMFQVLSEMNGQYLINGKSFPATDAYSLERDRPALLRVINMGEMDHPMHLHGFLFTEVAVDGGQVPLAAQFERYTQDVAPGEAYDLAFTPNEDGVWLFHCHILAHVTGANGTDAGMITALKVG
jgi:FtsP/CotA-like multicopper oxidase with cupredoxin domain